MSRENVQIVRRVFEAWNRADLERIRDYISPEWEWHTARLFPGTDAVYRGKEGFTRFWNTFQEPWESGSRPACGQRQAFPRSGLPQVSQVRRRWWRSSRATGSGGNPYATRPI